MTAHRSDARESSGDETAESTARTRRAAARVARVNENGSLSVLLGGALLARGVRERRRSGAGVRAVAQGVLGAGLIAVGLRQRRSEAGTGDDGGTADEAAAHREGQRVLEQSETNPRGTSGEPDVESQTDSGDVEFTDEQDLESGRKPDLEDESDVEDPRSSGDDAEVDLSEASMADEVSEATGPSSTQAQPAQTDDTEPERTAEADPEADVEGEDSTGDDSDRDAPDDAGGSVGGSGDESGDGGHGPGDDPDPDADPGEATAEAAAEEPADAAEEAIEGEIDDADREGVETKGGTTVHTDTNESDAVDVDVEDVTDDGDAKTGTDVTDGETGSHLDEEPPDEKPSDEELPDEAETGAADADGETEDDGT